MALGKALQASIIVTLLLKELGVANVIVEAKTDIHAKALAR